MALYHAEAVGDTEISGSAIHCTVLGLPGLVDRGGLIGRFCMEISTEVLQEVLISFTLEQNRQLMFWLPHFIVDRIAILITFTELLLKLRLINMERISLHEKNFSKICINKFS